MSKTKQNPKAVVLIDQDIGDPENPIRVYAQLDHLLEDVEDYAAKLRFARQVPKDAQVISMDDARIDVIAQQIDMPETTRREIDKKNSKIYQELVRYYEKLNRTLEIESTMLAITMNNTWSDDPEPYEEKEAPRKRPGLISIPEPDRDLSDSVERRLKQLMDKLSDHPEAFSQFMEAVERMSIDARRRLTARDNDGFQPRTINTDIPDGDKSLDGGQDKEYS